MSNCPNQEKNKTVCACKSADCERHGVCCECIQYHRENGNLPVCLR